MSRTVRNFVVKNDFNQGGFHKDKSKELPKEEKHKNKWLDDISDIDQELNLYDDKMMLPESVSSFEDLNSWMDDI